MEGVTLIWMVGSPLLDPLAAHSHTPMLGTLARITYLPCLDYDAEALPNPLRPHCDPAQAPQFPVPLGSISVLDC